MLKNALIILFVLANVIASSQVSILNSMFNAFNVSEETFLYCNLMNTGDEQNAYVEAKLYNGLNQQIVSVRSNMFKLKNGLTNTAQIGLTSNLVSYGSDNDAQYIKTMHQLPSGKFRFCLFVVPTGNNEPVDLCEEFENETSTFLFLVNPADNDTIENKHPILLWNHSDPFTLLKQGEMYRLILCEEKKDQSADAAINVNFPILKLDFLSRHDIQYPFDGQKLQEGHRYAWQVQKVINNVVVNKTEAWDFIIKPKDSIIYSKYVEIKTIMSSSPYIAEGNKIFFIYREEYASGSQLKVSIVPENKAAMKNVKSKDDINSLAFNTKTMGDNKYEIDLNELAISKGYYYLNIINEKGKVYQLKFYVK